MAIFQKARGVMLILLLGISVVSARAQTPPPAAPPAQTPQGGTQTAPPPLIRVFLDCYECDTTYIRQNVEFVEYVRDRAVADLHVLVTTRTTGSGGLEWTMKIIGLDRFQGDERTMTFTTPQSASSDDRRKEFARLFKIGMAGYAAGTAAARDMDVTWTAPKDVTIGPKKDPWNYWVFRMNGNTNVNGEESTSFRSYRGSFAANRVTDNWKINMSASGNKSESRYDVTDRTIHSTSQSWNVSGLVVKSLGPKWSAGGRAGAAHSSFSNTDRSITFAPGLEFDFFPYSESNRRSLTINYAIGATSYRYAEVTIFDKLSETVPDHAVNVSLGLRQPWGSLSVYSSFRQHLNHTDRYRSALWGSADVRLFKGFSFNVFAEYERIKDQIGLPKEGASEEEILLRLQQLSTGYGYFFSAGFSYSFGSIFNSVVNPRFSGLDIF